MKTRKKTFDVRVDPEQALCALSLARGIFSDVVARWHTDILPPIDPEAAEAMKTALDDLIDACRNQL